MDDPNRPESEQDGIRAEAQRRMRVRRLSAVKKVDAAPENSLDKVEEYLAWAISRGMRSQVGSAEKPSKSTED